MSDTVCSFCGKAFPTPDKLGRHRRVTHPAEVRAANIALLEELKAKLMARIEAPPRLTEESNL